MKFEDVEAARKAYWDKFKKALLILFVPVALFGILCFTIGPFPASFVLGISMFVAIIIFGVTVSKDRTAYHKVYKAYFVEQNLHRIFTDVVYAHEGTLNPLLVRRSGMINLGDIFTSNDLTVGKYKNVSFCQADAHIQTESTDSDGDTTYTTIFKGRFMIFEFPKKFDFKLEVIGKKCPAFKVPKADSITGRKMVRIKTESEEFNRTFKIYGQDGFETFYLLDPAMIVRIQDIASHYKNRILLGFYDNQMLVALNDGKDSFEPPRASRPIDESKEMQKVASDIKVITDFVDVISSH